MVKGLEILASRFACVGPVRLPDSDVRDSKATVRGGLCYGSMPQSKVFLFRILPSFIVFQFIIL